MNRFGYNRNQPNPSLYQFPQPQNQQSQQQQQSQIPQQHLPMNMYSSLNNNMFYDYQNSNPNQYVNPMIQSFQNNFMMPPPPPISIFNQPQQQQLQNPVALDQSDSFSDEDFFVPRNPLENYDFIFDFENMRVDEDQIQIKNNLVSFEDNLIDKSKLSQNQLNNIDNWMCAICCSLKQNVLKLDCNHSFCELCIKESFKIKKTCPLCRQQISSINESNGFSIYQKKKGFIDQVTTYQINKLPIICQNQVHGCKWEGTFGTFKEHIQKFCQFKAEKCENKGCEQFILVNQLSAHKQGCPFELVLCLYCEEKVQKQHLLKHLTESCSLMYFTCEICHLSIQNHDKDNHQKICTKQAQDKQKKEELGDVQGDYEEEEKEINLKQCSQASLGCPYKGNINQLHKHESNQNCQFSLVNCCKCEKFIFKNAFDQHSLICQKEEDTKNAIPKEDLCKTIIIYLKNFQKMLQPVQDDIIRLAKLFGPIDSSNYNYHKSIMFINYYDEKSAENTYQQLNGKNYSNNQQLQVYFYRINQDLPNYRVFVLGILNNKDYSQLYQYFQKYGLISEIKVFYNKDQNKSNSNGYVQFIRKVDANNLILKKNDLNSPIGILKFKKFQNKQFK